MRIVICLLLPALACAQAEEDSAAFAAKLHDAKVLLAESPDALSLISDALSELEVLAARDPKYRDSFARFADEVAENEANVGRAKTAIAALKEALALIEQKSGGATTEEACVRALAQAKRVRWYRSSETEWLDLLSRVADGLLREAAARQSDADEGDDARLLAPLRMAGSVLSQLPQTVYGNDRIRVMFPASDKRWDELLEEYVLRERIPWRDLLLDETSLEVVGATVKREPGVLRLANRSDDVATATVSKGGRWMDYDVELKCEFRGDSGFEILQRYKPDVSPGCRISIDELFPELLQKGTSNEIQFQLRAGRCGVGKIGRAPVWRRCGAGGANSGTMQIVIPRGSSLVIELLRVRVIREQ